MNIPATEMVVFNGTVMRGQPAHANLNAATFLREVRTAPRYRLFSIRDQYPAMARASVGGASIRAELYHVPAASWPSIRDIEPPGLFRGPVELADGSWVDGMLGNAELTLVGVDITAFGGWVEYLQRRA